MGGPYESSSPTYVGDLTKGEILYIKDVESLALYASRSHIEQAADLHEQAIVSSPPPFNLEHFPPLHHPSSPTYASPGSPLTTPSFDDPTLLKSLNIFTDKSPISPSVLPLNSIRFENVTISHQKG